jgi:hypothetical protein
MRYATLLRVYVIAQKELHDAYPNETIEYERRTKGNEMDMNRIMRQSTNDAYRVALSFWAEQGGYSNDEIQAWYNELLEKYPTYVPFDAPEMIEFFALYPIELPRDDAGKVDVQRLDQMTYLQRALITAQAADVTAECAFGGGDDTWFDYLPAGIQILRTLQSEEWAHTFAAYVNEVTSVEDEDERFNAETTFDESHDFYIMDVCTFLLRPYL